MGVFNTSMWNVAAAGAAKGAVDLLEADADSDTFVCEFTGTGEETGAGGGLSGSDLVLTEVGTVGDASDGWRALNSGGFTVTTDFLENFFTGSNTQTLVMHCKNPDVTPSANNGFFNWVSSDAQAGLYIQIPSGGGNEDKLIFQNINANAYVGTGLTSFEGDNMFGASDEFWLCHWMDGTYDRVGWIEGEDAPSNWSDFPSGQRATASHDWGDYDHTGQQATMGVGTNNSNVVGIFEINRFIMSKSGTLITND